MNLVALSTLLLVVGESCVLVRGERQRLLVLLHQADGLAGHVHVVAYVGLLACRNRLELLVERHFVLQIFDKLAQAPEWCRAAICLVRM